MNCKRLQDAADVRRTGTQTYFLYFKCPATKQIRCPVNAYLILSIISPIQPVQSSLKKSAYRGVRP